MNKIEPVESLCRHFYSTGELVMKLTDTVVLKLSNCVTAEVFYWNPQVYGIGLNTRVHHAQIRLRQHKEWIGCVECYHRIESYAFPIRSQGDAVFKLRPLVEKLGKHFLIEFDESLLLELCAAMEKRKP